TRAGAAGGVRADLALARAFEGALFGSLSSCAPGAPRPASGRRGGGLRRAHAAGGGAFHSLLAGGDGAQSGECDQRVVAGQPSGSGQRPRSAIAGKVDRRCRRSTAVAQSGRRILRRDSATADADALGTSDRELSNAQLGGPRGPGGEAGGNFQPPTP